MLSLALAAASIALGSSKDVHERDVGQALAIGAFLIAVSKLGEQ